MERVHLFDHARRRDQAETPAEKPAGRTKRAGEGAAAARFHRNRAALFHVGQQMKGRRRQVLQIGHGRRVWVSNHNAATAESYTRNSSQVFRPPQSAQQFRQDFLALTPHYDVYEWKRLQRLDVDRGCLRPAKHDDGLRVGTLYLPRQAHGERIAVADRAESVDVRVHILQRARRLEKELALTPVGFIVNRFVEQPVEVEKLAGNFPPLQNGGKAQYSQGRVVGAELQGLIPARHSAFKFTGLRSEEHTSEL